MVSSSPIRPLSAAAAACLLAGCLLADNPAYKSSGTGVGTEAATTTGGESSTGEPTCPDGQPPKPWYPDADMDGYGDAKAMPELACDPPDGFLADHTDCKDMIDAINPGAAEACNDLDDDCDSLIDGAVCGACKILLTSQFVYWICPLPDGEKSIAWNDAEARCKQFSQRFPVHLLSVHSKDEYLTLAPLVEKYIPEDEQGTHHAWLGLAKLPDKPDDCNKPDPKKDWKWVDNSKVDTTAWNKGEPSNGSDDCECGSMTCPYERCVEIKINKFMDGGYSGWNDIPCDSASVNGYVCKAQRDPELFPSG